MTYIIQWTGESPVAFYEGNDRIEMKKNETRKVNIIPAGGGFNVLDNDLDALTIDIAQAEKEELKSQLVSTGLSPIRLNKVLARFDSLRELKLNLDNLPFEEITNEFLRKEFQEKKENKKHKR